MKIDPNIQATGLQNVQVGNAKTAGPRLADAQASNAASETSQDTVRLSSQHVTLAQLSAQLSGVPELRVDRVNAFQAKVQQGTYAPDSGKVADAILAQQAQSPGRA